MTVWWEHDAGMKQNAKEHGMNPDLDTEHGVVHSHDACFAGGGEVHWLSSQSVHGGWHSRRGHVRWACIGELQV